MSGTDVQEIRVQAPDGRLATIRVRVKCPCDKDGVGGVLFAMLDPDTLFEVGEYWAPVVGNPGLDALLGPIGRAFSGAAPEAAGDR
jgi:hypothetical protein